MKSKKINAIILSCLLMTSFTLGVTIGPLPAVALAKQPVAETYSTEGITPEARDNLTIEDIMPISAPIQNMQLGEMTVSGTGTIKVQPDIAVLSIGVTTRGTDTSVQQINAAEMEKVLDTIKAMGVEDKDIKTASYYMNPIYDYSRYDGGTLEITGYTVTNMVNVTVSEIDNAGVILSKATAAGANENGGVYFTLSDSQAAYNEALAAAVQNGSGKANALAAALNVKIGLPTSVKEVNNGYTTYTSYSKESGMVANDAAGGVIDAPIQAGELTITASVELVYSYSENYTIHMENPTE